ncbi:unnamed protein product [Closterium sp. Naga37s-1]|nr:unnamed protein product [Closterium sp. Naga37s-1]
MIYLLFFAQIRIVTTLSTISHGSTLSTISHGFAFHASPASSAFHASSASPCSATWGWTRAALSLASPHTPSPIHHTTLLPLFLPRCSMGCQCNRAPPHPPFALQRHLGLKKYSPLACISLPSLSTTPWHPSPFCLPCSPAAAWEAPSTERHLIPSRLISFALQRHLGMDEGAVRVAAGQLDFALQVAGKDPASSAPALNTAFERLASLLRQLPSLPLSVAALHSLSPTTRGAAAFPPSPCPPPSAGGAAEEEGVWRRCVDPVPVAVQLEASSKWPDDPEALRLTRHAFCLQIASSLQEAHGVAVEAARGAVDVMLDGFALRLVLLHDYVPPAEDVTSSNPSSLTPIVTPSPIATLPLSSSSFSETHRTLQHHSTLNGLTGRHPTFGPIARLAKRWVAAHLFSSHLKEEAVELLVAHTLTAPNPLLLPAPKSRLAGLLRFFRLVASYDWLSQPLIVDVNSAFSPEDVQQIQARFDERLPPHKDTLGSSARSVAKRLKQSAVEGGREGEGEKERRPAMCIATPYDRDGAMWTHLGPSVEALERLCAFAESAAQVLAQLITGEGEEGGGGEEGGRKGGGKGKERGNEKHRAVQWKSLFLSPLSTTFDLIIHLDPASLPHHDRGLFPAPKALSTAKGWLQVPSSLSPTDSTSSSSSSPSTALPPSLHRLASAGPPLLIGFNPTALLLTHLQERFGSVLTFWYDGLCGSEVIGATWRIPIGASADGGAAAPCLPRRAQQANLLPCSHQSEREPCKCRGGAGKSKAVHSHAPPSAPHSPLPSTLFSPFYTSHTFHTLLSPGPPHSPLPYRPLPSLTCSTKPCNAYAFSPPATLTTHQLLSPFLPSPLTSCSLLSYRPHSPAALSFPAVPTHQLLSPFLPSPLTSCSLLSCRPHSRAALSFPAVPTHELLSPFLPSPLTSCSLLSCRPHSPAALSFPAVPTHQLLSPFLPSPLTSCSLLSCRPHSPAALSFPAVPTHQLLSPFLPSPLTSCSLLPTPSPLVSCLPMPSSLTSPPALSTPHPPHSPAPMRSGECCCHHR